MAKRAMAKRAMAKKSNVLILGYGRMGQAMEHLLAASHNLRIWDKYPPPGFEPDVLEEAAPEADFILFCMPVNPHREVVTLIKPMLKETSICLSIAKGLDEDGQTAAQIFADVLGDEHQYVLLYGPMIAEEISIGRSAFAQVGSASKAISQQVIQLYSGRHLYLRHSSDVAGISWAVILKNVYAMLFGVAEELQLGDNVRGFLAVEALDELDRIVRYMGGREGCSYHLAGLGDLITTATSATSHHHNTGRRLGRGETDNIEGEGVHTLAMVEKYGLLNEADYPLFRLMHNIIKSPAYAKSLLHQYIEAEYEVG